MTIVQSQITRPDGTGSPGWVTVRADDYGLRPGSLDSVIGVNRFRVEGDGAWALDLVPNAEGAHYYRVTEAPDEGVPRERLIHVKESAAPRWLSDLVVILPIPSGVDGAIYRGPEGPKGDPGPPGNISGAAFATAVANEMADGTAARTVLNGEYEARVDRTGATAGQAVILQADGTLDFGTVAAGSGSGTVTSVNGQTPNGQGAVTVTGSQITGLATVATSGSYNDLTNKPPQIVYSATRPDAPASGQLLWVKPAGAA